jgi:hypothetical protein
LKWISEDMGSVLFPLLLLFFYIYFNTGVTEDPFIWGYDATSMDKGFPTFRENVLVSKLLDMIIQLTVF